MVCLKNCEFGDYAHRYLILDTNECIYERLENQNCYYNKNILFLLPSLYNNFEYCFIC